MFQTGSKGMFTQIVTSAKDQLLDNFVLNKHRFIASMQ